MPHQEDYISGARLLVGVNGIPCHNWSDWSGGSFSGIVCPDCTGAPPHFSGKHASSCTSCSDNYEGCEGDTTSLSGTHIVQDEEEDPSDCRGGFAEYSCNSALGCSVGIGSYGQATATGLVSAAAFVGARPLRISGSYSWNVSCGAKKDVVKGQCISGFEGPTEDGICVGGTTANISLNTIGVSDSSDNYPCPCNCDVGPLLTYCNADAALLADICEGGQAVVAGLCEDPQQAWDDNFAQANIKGNVSHSVGRDFVEIVAPPDSQSCAELYPDPLDSGLCTNFNTPYGSITIPGLTFMGLPFFGSCPSDSGEIEDGMFAQLCPDRCGGNCPPGTGAIDYEDHITHPSGCGHAPQVLNEITDSCTAWDCMKHDTCSFAVGGGIVDPIIITPSVCYIAVSVSVDLQPGAGGCAEGPGPLCAQCDCEPSCEDGSLVKPITCGQVQAAISVETA